MKTVEDFYYQASGLVLTDYFTYDEIQDEDFDVCEYMWEAMAYLDAKDLYGYISQIATNLFQAYELGLEEKE